MHMRAQLALPQPPPPAFHHLPPSPALLCFLVSSAPQVTLLSQPFGASVSSPSLSLLLAQSSLRKAKLLASLPREMLTGALDAQPIPGVDMACSAMYLSLVGEMPEAYCPPGCTLHATMHGTIYVLDHVHRIGYPLQLPQEAEPAQSVQPTVAPVSPGPALAPYVAPVEVPAPHLPVRMQPSCEPATHAPEESALAVSPRVMQHKRGRASSTDSSASTSLNQIRNRRCSSRDPSVGPTTQHENASSLSPHSSPAQQKSSKPHFKTHPQFFLIPPRSRWLEDIYFTLQLSGQWTHRPNVFFFCHYCRVYFSASAKGVWHHLSQPRGHRLQRQRVRNYLSTGNRLLSSAEKPALHVTTPEELSTVPAKHFPNTHRLQVSEKVHFLPACVTSRTIMNSEQRERVVRDGAAYAAKIVAHESMADKALYSFENEPPQLVGWRFLMEGLDIVRCYCSEKKEPLQNSQLLHHHKNYKGK
uniref:Uncharacterized protein n=1 Tax=Leptomonas seymouri TaxID=5684 RepID=C6K3Y1_LEPSE|nr:conserved hypothetical protein [Leptomonas seymouri]